MSISKVYATSCVAEHSETVLTNGVACVATTTEYRVRVKGGRCTSVVVAVIVVVATVVVTALGTIAELTAELRIKLDDSVTCRAVTRTAELGAGRLARLIALVGARIAE